MKIGIIIATDFEYEAISKELTNEYEADVFKYSLSVGHNQYLIQKCGAGKVNAAHAATMLCLAGCNMIISVGVCGTASGLGPRTVVVPDIVVQGDCDTTALGEHKGFIQGTDKWFLQCDETLRNILIKCSKEVEKLPTSVGWNYTSDTFIKDLNKLHFNDFFDCPPASIDMEGAAIAQICNKMHTRFAMLKVVSDGCNSKEYENSKTNSAKICGQVIHSFIEYNEDKKEIQEI